MILRIIVLVAASMISVGACEKIQHDSEADTQENGTSRGRDTVYVKASCDKDCRETMNRDCRETMDRDDVSLLVEQAVEQALAKRTFTLPEVPVEFEFAGQKVRFDSCEKYERMEREILAFCYMHSQSILMLKRSSIYFPQVEPILREKGIPDDFKFLMVIESNLEPKSLSAAGAAGLWQFTKASAKEWRLEVNEYVDERYNTKRATEAACDYLNKSFSLFNDWFTVAASYNAGTNALKKFVAQQHRTSAFDLWMAEETTRYIYRLIACKMLFENPSSFGFDVPQELRYHYVKPRKIVSVTETVSDLAEFALSNGVTYAELKRANLWLRSSKLPDKSHKLYQIVIPGDEHIKR